MLLSSDTSVGVAKSMGVGTIGFAEAFDRLAPDVIVVLGDRFEALSAAQAALVARIPIAHIHGGETTEGAVDEMIRHSVTKMAYLHFVATDTFRQRVIQLGEQPARVFTVGAPGLDYLRRLDLMSREELEESLDFELGEPTFLITYHPATLQNVSPDEAVEELLEALADFPEARFVFTKANADAGGHFINRRIERYVEEQAEQARLYDSLGQRRYLSALHHADVVIGNSSSGLIEAPAVPVPTVNVGDRQKGRPKAESVIDCPENSEEISRAIELALSEKLKKSIEGMSSPYGSGGAASRIRKHLRNVNISDLSKPFYDLEIIIG